MTRLLPAIGLALALGACATTPLVRRPPPRVARHITTPPPAPHGRPAPRMVEVERTPAPFTSPEPARGSSLADLPGWAEEDHAAAFRAFAQACNATRELPMQAACAEARAEAAHGAPDDAHARRWFERRFRPAALPGEGVLTAYFAPVYSARSRPDGEFTAPVRPRPREGVRVAAPTPSGLAGVDDPLALLGDAQGEPPPPPPSYGGAMLYADRTSIEASPADGALAWMRPEDLFFLQIQGSGVLVLEDGRRMKALYAADNGRPFTAIARPMAAEGLLPRDKTSGDNIRAWLHAHAGREAQAVMQKNARYIFFAVQPDDGREPAGAAGVALPPGRSLAIDPSRHAYGELYWIEADAPVLAGAARRYRRLALALDTGAAIRGEVRADLYIGSGDEAGREAGRVRHTLHMVRLVPVDPAGP